MDEVGMGFAFAQKWIVNGRLLNHPPASIGAAEIHANKLMMLHACYKADQGKDVRHEAATCKVYASEMGCRVVDKVIRCMRGMGERYYRDLRRSRITEGASEVQRFIMARSLLKGYSPLDPMAE